MDFELWWLLPIPAVFFALGWIAARIDIKHLLRESRALPLSYFRGLNFLLNEQPDKAIESFIEVVKVDPQTIDLHFALGSLFRRQGEIDRAIRMHQNLLDRPDLPADKRVDRDLRARAGLPSRGPARPRRGALHQARRHAVRARGARPPHLDLRDGEGLGEGDRRDAAHGGDRQAAVLQGDRAIPLRARAGGAAARGLRGGDAPTLDAAYRDLPRLRARHAAARRSRRRSRATLRRRDRRVAEDRVAEPGVPVARRRRIADAYRKLGDIGAGHPRAAQPTSAQYPSLDLLNALFSLVLEHEGPEAAATLDQGRARAQPDAARPRPAARSAARWRRRPSAGTTSSW